MDPPGTVYVCHFNGQRIKRPSSSWVRIRELAGLPAHVTPHVLRHSRATHMMRQRVDPWVAANSLGMSLEMLTRVYGHHHPDWQKDAADAR
jgi:integrase